MRLPLTAWMFLLSSVLIAQELRFSHLDQKQGLSQNTATAFLQDRDGFIWVGTQDGLNRYDGYAFTVYRTVPNDTNSLCDNFILSLAEDNDGTIWIGTRNGLCAYRKSSDK
ncbi:MAG TPA: two-component regulator propeller domain-containing protein, partial [Bacteroidia bacterium]|nr:two-component regulator propeller domain-containing protein [Bacteroidia bacterium]